MTYYLTEQRACNLEIAAPEIGSCTYQPGQAADSGDIASVRGTETACFRQLEQQRVSCVANVV